MLWMPVVGCLLSFLAIGFLIGAIVTYVKQRQKFAERASTTGVVLSLEMRSNTASQNGGVIYCPLVEFKTNQGETIQFESEFGTLPASHQVGQTVKVSFNPLDPQKAEIDSTMNRTINSLVLAFMGLILLCIGLFFLVLGTFVTLSVK
jgi:predicted outer membrane repeat protein